MTFRIASFSLIAALLLLAQPKPDLKLPNEKDSLKFAVLGDAGTGEKPQYQIGELAEAYHQMFPFTFSIYVGDNLYGGEAERDFKNKFELPYKALLDDGVKFYAALGNHDDPNQRFYKNFNMNGKRYYSFKPKNGVRFFALDSTYMGPEQLEWFEKELADSGSDWKIAFCHHPPYSSGEKHGSSLELRRAVEPLFLKYGVNVVFTGHEHFYERIKPQKGVYYFIEGASGKLRKDNIAVNEWTAKGYDQDNTFMLVEIAGDKLYFQTIARSGEIVDSGTIERPAKKAD